MNFITGNYKLLYRKFLLASVAGALVMSIYSFVDTIVIGQYEGEVGTAAMAVINPLYGTLIFLSILCGVGGAVLMGNAKGKGREEKGNAYFTAAVILGSILTITAWIVLFFFHQQIFTFFGADQSLMPKVMEYAKWIVYFAPVFIIPAFLGSFIRNDGAPKLVMWAVIIGGCINIFLDWFLVFPLDMGMEGAALATVSGTIIQILIMSTHFFRKKCKLRLVLPHKTLKALYKILIIGFGASVLELGTIFLAIVMNNQIMKYGGESALAVYGVVGTISMLFQAIFAGVGQAIQPLVSANYGAMQEKRIKSFWRRGLITVIIFGVIFMVIGELFPEGIVRLFIDVSKTPDTLIIAPSIIRPYFLLFPFLGISVLSTYYLQSIMRGKMSLLIALLRSIILSGAFLYLLPLVLDLNGVWIALPLSEIIVTTISIIYIYTSPIKFKKEPPKDLSSLKS
ncbi:MAG TPA: MATE family efflux transporter [Candidatus Onthovivens sp.]|nr:MATE family efflux transporter [Candidatus Onthovivens sp.]